jgi:hypothetical protein
MNCRVGRMEEEAYIVYINVIFWLLLGGLRKSLPSKYRYIALLLN